MKQEDLFSSLSSIKEISYKIRNGDLSPVDLVKTCFHRIKKMNPILNAFITVIDEHAVYEQALICEREIKQGNYRGPLHGIPFSIKDILYAKGVRCTAGSKILANYIPKEDSTVVTKVKKAGAILMGTNNLNEFASGITGINPFYGSSKNPWDITRISGGSSGGSAVAVATGMVFFSLGTDTGGSTRVPASLCGIVGLKPTYGFISKHNVFPLSPSLDHVGCITRNVWDAAAVLECVADIGILDKTLGHNRTFKYTKIIEGKRCKKNVIGIPQKYFFDFINPEVEHLFYNFIESISKYAIICQEKINLHNTAKYFKSWRNIRLAESSDVHSEWIKTRPMDYSTEVRELLLEGNKISAVDYVKSMGLVKEIRGNFLSILRNEADALIVPTTIIPAPRFEDDAIDVGDDDVVLTTREALLRNTIIFNSIGLPTVSIPVGLTNNRLPIGVQIVGAPYNEDLVLSIAYDCEQQLNNTTNKPVPPICMDKM